jgi:endonuclease III
MAPRLTTIIAALERRYGRPKPPRITDPWHMILHENAAYLVDDDRRDEVFESLRKAIGLRPAALLKAERAGIAAAIARGGMQPDRRAQKLIDAAEIVTTDFKGDLRPVLALPEPKARKALKLFPGVGDPFADRIFLYTRTHPILALDSNALRVLIRLGFGTESTNYSKTHKSVQAALSPELPADFDALIAASQLLRQHGQDLCRRTNPDCPACPLQTRCPFAASR